jgi:hypothetical protein
LSESGAAMTIEWTVTEGGYSGIKGVCPFVDWALGTEHSTFFPTDHGAPKDTGERRLPVMLRLDDITPAEFADGTRFFSNADDVARWRQRVRVSALYTAPAMRTRKRFACTALVTRWFFEELGRNEALLRAVARVTLGLPLREESLPPSGAEVPGAQP